MDTTGTPDEPEFNAGQQMNIHDGDAVRLVLDDTEERRYQVDAGDGHDLTAKPPAGTVGAETWMARAEGGPGDRLQSHDAADHVRTPEEVERRPTALDPDGGHV